MKLKTMTAAEFCRQPRGDEIPELLRYAAVCIEAGNLGSACWRLADAGFLLRRRMLRRGFMDAEGLDFPTGRGALLPAVPVISPSTFGVYGETSARTNQPINSQENP
jgi:hypothetical protein